MAQIDDYFQAFCHISESLQMHFERDVILGHIIESAIQAMRAKACALFMVKSRYDFADPFFTITQVGLSDSYLHTATESKLATITKTLETEGYLLARDAVSDPRLENHETKKKEGIGSILIVPVTVEKDLIGALTLYTAETRDFSRLEIDFLSALANQGGLAILRSHKEYRIRKEIELFKAVAAHLNSTLDIKEVLRMTTSEIAKAFDLKGVTIRLLDNGSRELKLVADYGLSNEYLNKGPISAEREKAFLEKEVEYIEDVTVSDDIDYKRERIAEGIISMLHLPIIIKGSSIGLMGLYAAKKRSLSEEDIAMMTSIATQCGLAIHNASMYLQLKEEKDCLEEEMWGHKSWF